tara:strand:- start:110 stop:583 length:474 start_codon:yes stop_codon:yes gene_type:complete
VANKKQPHNWGKVKPGDIISFRYKPKSGNPPKTQTILVLNPRLNVTLKDGKTTKQLIGIKLEESNKISLRVNKKQITLLEQIGKFVPIDIENNLYRLNIDSTFITNDIKGVKPRAYDLLSKSFDIQGQYRTYDYTIAKKSSVYLEPIRVFTKVDDED